MCVGCDSSQMCNVGVQTCNLCVVGVTRVCGPVSQARLTHARLRDNNGVHLLVVLLLILIYRCVVPGNFMQKASRISEMCRADRGKS